MAVEYSFTHPGGRCYWCKDRLQKVTAGPDKGKWAFVRTTDEIGNAVVSHVGCGERNIGPKKTADWDHYGAKAGTAKKPTYDNPYE